MTDRPPSLLLTAVIATYLVVATPIAVVLIPILSFVEAIFDRPWSPPHPVKVAAVSTAVFVALASAALARPVIGELG